MLVNTQVTNTHSAVKQALIKLRDYQEKGKQGVYNEWYKGAINVCLVFPTGAGKTVTFGSIVNDHKDQPAVVIAHRQELVTQISLALAKYGIKHDIMAPRNVIKHIVKQHTKVTGYSYYSPSSKIKVAGVDTLKSRRNQQEVKDWAKTVKLWVQDECHHILKKNKWGKAVDMFPNAKGLGVTATPERTDGCGLGKNADGVFDTLVVGPSLRDMIDLGWLTDYVIYAPPETIDFSDITTGANGDYTSQELRKREQKSHVIGDVVEQYLKLIPGKLAVTFASNVKSAMEFARAFNFAGVKAGCVHGGTPDNERISTMDQFAKGELRQCTNVDIFGEGYDLPAIDAVQMVRKTESFGLFVQQGGRALRPVFAPGMPLDTPEQRKAAIAAGPKPVAYIIDHVGNVAKHAVAVNGVIDIAYRQWTLDGKKRGASSSGGDSVPVKTCKKCSGVYEPFFSECPYCKYPNPPAERKEPKHVEGDLTELDPSVLTQIKLEVDKIQGPEPYSNGGVIGNSLVKNHRQKAEAQDRLKAGIDQWAGYQKALGRSDKEAYKRFWYKFGIDVLTAQTGTAREMIGRLTEIENHMVELHKELETV